MLIITDNISKCGEDSYSTNSLFLIEKFPVTWDDLVKTFNIFLASDEHYLILIQNPTGGDLKKIQAYLSNEYFDCFDIRTPSLTWKIARIKLSRAIKIVIFSMKLYIPLRIIDKSLSHRFKHMGARQLAINQIAHEIGVDESIVVNYFQPESKARIYSRRAAEIYVNFNVDSLISSESVFESSLRSSNISFGSVI